MYTLHDICAVIDLDGFMINKVFRVRELGFASLTKKAYGSYRFNLTDFTHQMTQADWKTAMYCKFRIHGLSLRPSPREKNCYNEKDLNSIINQIHEENKTHDKYVVGYKGGIVEKNLLEKLCIPSVNLEDFGCPKYSQLVEPKIKDCGYHIRIDSVHCAMKESFAFAAWVSQRLSDSFLLRST